MKAVVRAKPVKSVKVAFAKKGRSIMESNGVTDFEMTLFDESGGRVSGMGEEALGVKIEVIDGSNPVTLNSKSEVTEEAGAMAKVELLSNWNILTF